MELGLKGKHVLITGASGGIGLVTAEMFLKEGAKVSLHYRSQEDSLSGLLEQYPNDCFKVQASATSENEVQNAMKLAIDKFGTIHILIANHGMFPSESVSLKDMSLEQFKNTIDVNLNGIFLFTREWLRNLESAKNRHEELTNINCVIIGSTAGIFGEAGHIDYSSAKAALTYGFCKSLKNELPNLIPNSRVNIVAPGWVLTPMAQNAIDKDPSIIPKALQTVPLNKIASPKDCANAIVYLASSAAGHTSGTILNVDGGMEGRCLNPLN